MDPGTQTIPLVMIPKNSQALQNRAGENVLIDLDIRKALNQNLSSDVENIQVDPLKRITLPRFYEVAMEKWLSWKSRPSVGKPEGPRWEGILGTGPER